jgi:hypothetical protein
MAAGACCTEGSGIVGDTHKFISRAAFLSKRKRSAWVFAEGPSLQRTSHASTVESGVFSSEQGPTPDLRNGSGRVRRPAIANGSFAPAIRSGSLVLSHVLFFVFAQSEILLSKKRNLALKAKYVLLFLGRGSIVPKSGVVKIEPGPPRQKLEGQSKKLLFLLKTYISDPVVDSERFRTRPPTDYILYRPNGRSIESIHFQQQHLCAHAVETLVGLIKILQS